MLDGAKAWVSAPAMYLLLQRTWREKRKEEEKEGLEWGGNKLSMHIVHKFDKLHSHTHTHTHALACKSGKENVIGENNCDLASTQSSHLPCSWSLVKGIIGHNYTSRSPDTKSLRIVCSLEAINVSLLDIGINFARPGSSPVKIT
jgi:hypothetical protein